MKLNRTKQMTTLGDFIMAAYDICGKQDAPGIVWLAVNAEPVESGGQLKIIISDQAPKSISNPPGDAHPPS